MSNILLILFPTQLFEFLHIKKIFDYNFENNKNNQKMNIILFEHPYFFTKYLFHKMKLILHRSSMKNYLDLLKKNKKINPLYIEYNELEKIDFFIKSNKINEIRFFNPIEQELIDLILNNKIFINTLKLIFPSPYFLNCDKSNKNNEIFENLGGLRHDLFYKSQRINFNIMVKKEGEKYIPEGSKWSFDIENRKPFEKTQEEPKILNLKSKKRDEYLNEAFKYIEKNFSNNYGISDLKNFIYPINRKEALLWLQNFISYKLDNFGKYEDALHSKIKFGYHSILSPLTNIGLITPKDIIDNVDKYKKNLASKEGFIRQVIGWREYCYFSYQLFKKELETHNIYSKNKNKIPKSVWECQTQIKPIDNILKNLELYAYSHHIERLMGIGNFLILIEVSPEEIYKWFQTMYIDAYDVFMIPNVYGMLCYGKLTEKSHLMTRPYFASSNYIMKMSDYKSDKCVKINNIEYKWDEILDSLYWAHVYKYSEEFKKIYATASAVSRFNKFDSSKKKNILELSNIYKKWIHGCKI